MVERLKLQLEFFTKLLHCTLESDKMNVLFCCFKHHVLPLEIDPTLTEYVEKVEKSNGVQINSNKVEFE